MDSKRTISTCHRPIKSKTTYVDCSCGKLLNEEDEMYDINNT